MAGLRDKFMPKITSKQYATCFPLISYIKNTKPIAVNGCKWQLKKTIKKDIAGQLSLKGGACP
ncbi:MAG: hypothetical protein NVS9B7_03470 [Flavisolibacter sp.]